MENEDRSNETTNEVVNEPRNDDAQADHEDDDEFLSLELGSTSFHRNMDDDIRGDWRRRLRQINRENDHRNEVVNEPRNDDAQADHEDDDESLSLMLGSTTNMDDDIRLRQLNRENDHRRNGTTNKVVNEPQNDDAQADHEDDESLSLRLDSIPYSSQIPLVSTSLRLEPPAPSAGPMTTPPAPFAGPEDFLTLWMGCSSRYSMPPPCLSSARLNNSLHQTGSRGLFSTPIQPPPANYFSLVPPSDQTTPPMRPVLTRPINTDASSSRPQPAVMMSQGNTAASISGSQFAVMMSQGNTAASSSRSQFAAMRPVMTSQINTAASSSGSQSAKNKKSGPIVPPFPWATTKRGEIYSLEYLDSKGITTITGKVKCIHCEKEYQVSYNLRERFVEVARIFRRMKMRMRERAPPMWSHPVHRRCESCGREKAVKPVIATKKCQINWLFMLLGQTLGYCTLGQLKNFCKHSQNHRTGAKDRVLYLTYLGLCKMLDPNNVLFDRDTAAKRADFIFG